MPREPGALQTKMPKAERQPSVPSGELKRMMDRKRSKRAKQTTLFAKGLRSAYLAAPGAYA